LNHFYFINNFSKQIDVSARPITQEDIQQGALSVSQTITNRVKLAKPSGILNTDFNTIEQLKKYGLIEILGCPIIPIQDSAVDMERRKISNFMKERMAHSILNKISDNFKPKSQILYFIYRSVKQKESQLQILVGAYIYFSSPISGIKLKKMNSTYLC
jgi:hypothetical protein